MSYPKDLDEYSDEELSTEIARRSTLKQMGLCTYCTRPGTTPSCKETKRHQQAAATHLHVCEDTGSGNCFKCGGRMEGQ